MTTAPNLTTSTGLRLAIAAVFRPKGGNWYFKGPGNSNWGDTKDTNVSIQCGAQGDIPVLADFNGTGRNQLAVFRPSNGTWYIKAAGRGDWKDTKDNNYSVQCGMAGDIPVAYDFFNEGRARIAVFRPSNGNWYIKAPGFENWSETKDSNITIQCGAQGDIPIVADFFNEGQNRIGVFRPKGGNWYIKAYGKQNWKDTKDNNVTIQCGAQGDIPCVGNFFGDGNRLAVFRPKGGNWFIKAAGQNNWKDTKDNNVSIQCGAQGDIPVSGDFFGEGRVRIAVFRPKGGNWFIKAPGTGDWKETKDTNLTIQFGANGDRPVLGNINFGRFNGATAFMFPQN